jgi:hypothetical protein
MWFRGIIIAGSLIVLTMSITGVRFILEAVKGFCQIISTEKRITCRKFKIAIEYVRSFKDAEAPDRFTPPPTFCLQIWQLRCDVLGIQ